MIIWLYENIRDFFCNCRCFRCCRRPVIIQQDIELTAQAALGAFRVVAAYNGARDLPLPQGVDNYAYVAAEQGQLIIPPHPSSHGTGFIPCIPPRNINAIQARE